MRFSIRDAPAPSHAPYVRCLDYLKRLQNRIASRNSGVGQQNSPPKTEEVPATQRNPALLDDSSPPSDYPPKAPGRRSRIDTGPAIHVPPSPKARQPCKRDIVRGKTKPKAKAKAAAKKNRRNSVCDCVPFLLKDAPYQWPFFFKNYYINPLSIPQVRKKRIPPIILRPR